MTILFAGGELSAFSASDFTNVTEATASTGRDTTYTRSAIVITNPAAWIETPVFASATTLWVHAEWQTGSASVSGVPITFYNSVGTAVFRLNGTAGPVLQMQYWNGSTWTNIGTSFGYTSATRYTIDIKLVCGSSGSAELYVSGSLISSASATMTAVTNVNKLRLSNTISSSYWTQIIAADESTVGWKLATLAPTADGANTTWTGTYADVDEATTVSDTDFISSANADEVETFTASDASGAGFTVKALVVAARARSGSGPQNIQMAVRSAGANYFSSSVANIGAGYAGLQAVFSTDPATGSAWTLANANSAEIGVKSVA
jgi:hypothetical protein